MTYTQEFHQGYQTFPAALLFHFKDLFPSASEFLIWQFFYYQNTSKLESLAPSEIAQATGLTLASVNHSIERLQAAALLDLKTIHINGEMKLIFDTAPAFEKLDAILAPQAEVELPEITNDEKSLVADFERELGRMLSPFEVEELQKTLKEDKLSADLIREALKEAVFINKTNWKYIQGILRNWRREGIRSPEQVAAKHAERELPQPQQFQASPEFLAAADRMWKE